jgi:hypothetical protein
MFFCGTNPRSASESTKTSGTNPRFERFLVKYEPKKSFRMSGAWVRTHDLGEGTQEQAQPKPMSLNALIRKVLI